MRAFIPACLVTLALTALAAPGVLASETKTATIQANARIGSRTSLTVSSEQLRFELAGADQPAVATVDFVAGARTQPGGEVVLTVETVRALEGPGGAADVEAAVSFSATGEGTMGGAMLTDGPVVAGRWTGSGRRSGRLSFSLRGAVPGTYTLPVRFILSAP